MHRDEITQSGLSAVPKSQRRSVRGNAEGGSIKGEPTGRRMRVAERATPVAAVIAALSTLACCLPFGFLGAVGLAGASVRLQSLRPWLLVSAAILLGIGFIQLYVP